MAKVCRHCGKGKVNRPAGLCWPCYYTPTVRDAFRSGHKNARRGVGNLTGRRPLPAEPTRALPGTQDKLDVMAARARRGERLWHPDDATVED
jgi:hypothetical protein